MAEDENVHPLVSNLLEQDFVPRLDGNVFRYDRDEMISLRTVPLSVSRPDNLSVDFNGDDGKFCPFKWLEYRWEVEGIKNRPANKKLQDALRADCDENAGLSPQRRGFSSGCRAPPDEKKEKDAPVSLKDEGWNTVDNVKGLFAASSSKWRSASTSSTEKFTNTKGNDFKLPFQKTAPTTDKTARSANWKTVEGKERQNGSFSSTGKFLPARSYRGMDERGEKLPEWADDPTTMDDMIELKGFDEPTKRKKNAKAERPRSEHASQSGSRPSSRNHHSEKEATGGNGHEMPTALPDTDAELAAILGLSDFPSSASSNQPNAGHSVSGLSGSRLSKFFNKGANGADEHSKENLNGPISVADEVASNPTLAKLFSHSSTGSASPQNVPKNVQNVRAPMRLEDLERGYALPRPNENGDASRFFPQQKLPEQIIKNNVLQDPQQQAQLLQKLHRVARQQEEGQSSSSPPLQRPAQPGVPPGTSGFPMPGMIPPVLPEHIIAAQAQHLLNMQLQQAYPGGVPPIQPQILDRMRSEMMRSLMARQQQVQALLANANLQQHAAAAVQQAKAQTARPAMIPASVQRHLHNKVNPAAPVDDKREKDRDGEEDNSMRQQAEALKKQQMQQQYTALMSAMQNGLPMAALRQQAVPATPGQQQSPQVQAMMAAHAQRMHQHMYLQKQQQQAAMMKLMALQQQQQQHQMMNQNGEGERAPHQYSSGNGNPDMLQVGPIQTPLEKLLTAAGVQPSQFTGSSDGNRTNGAPGFPPTARPMSLEEIERNISNGAPSLPPNVRPMSLQELESQLTGNPNSMT